MRLILTFDRRKFITIIPPASNGCSGEKQPVLIVSLTQALIMWLFSQCKHMDQENVWAVSTPGDPPLCFCLTKLQSCIKALWPCVSFSCRLNNEENELCYWNSYFFFLISNWTPVDIMKLCSPKITWAIDRASRCLHLRAFLQLCHSQGAQPDKTGQC